MSSRHDLKKMNEEMLLKNWLTNDLQKEIECYFPSGEDLIIDKFKNTCVRDPGAFHRNCQKMFPEHRIFASSK